MRTERSSSDRFGGHAASLGKPGIALLALLPAMPRSFGRSAPNSDSSDAGSNGVRDASLGEFEVDVGGVISFTDQGRTTNPIPANGNPLAPRAFPTVLDALRKHAADLRLLDSAIGAQCTLPNASLVLE